MYKLKNIANDRFKGALYKHEGHFGAQMMPHALRLEPFISNKLLRIGTEVLITDEDFNNCKDVIDTHVNGHVLEVTKLYDDLVSTVKPVVPTETNPINEVLDEALPPIEKVEEPKVDALKVEEIVPSVVIEETKEVEPVKKPGKKGR